MLIVRGYSKNHFDFQLFHIVLDIGYCLREEGFINFSQQITSINLV